MWIPTLALLASQIGAVPTIPAGLNEAFVTTCYAVEKDLANGDFDGAKTTASLLPKGHATIGWDDREVPVARREAFHRELDNVIAEAKPLIGLSVAAGGTPDITISFVRHLDSDRVGASLPPGARLLFRQGLPRVRTEISLTRSSPPQISSLNDVHNEIAYAVAQYVGIERVPRFGGYATRTDQSTNQRVVLSQPEIALGLVALDVSRNLESLIEAKTRITATAPSIVVSKSSIDGVKGLQDTGLQVSLKVTNAGNADLLLHVLPDCSCLDPAVAPLIKPGQSADLIAYVNTSLYTGRLNHSLLIFSNDPSRPVVEIPVTMDVEPLFRFVKPGSQTVPVGDDGADFDVYLILAEPVQVSVETASVVGFHATVQYHAWKGTAPDDPDSNGEPGSGYKFHIHMAPVKYPGQFPANLIIGTDSDAFRELNYTFQVQRGIVAMPGQFNFGVVPPEPTSFSILISSPAKPFKITEISTGSPYISAKATAVKADSEYRIDVNFNGKAGLGTYSATLAVHTDDPKQPVVLIPITGQVQ